MKYGKVLFGEGGEKGAILQKTLIERLSAQGVITVSPATIEKWYEADKAENVGCVHKYALHDKNEVDIFKTIMSSKEMQDDSVKWMVTRFDHDKKFTSWVEEVEARHNGINQYGVKE